MGLDPEDTRYFAIARPGSFGEAYGYPDPILLELKTAERGMQLIGHFAIDETGYW